MRWIFIAFLCSGASGLIYQTVWVRMLTRFLGGTTTATATVLATFMAGLALGSLLGGYWADRRRQLGRGLSLLPLYGHVELGIAAISLIASFAAIEGLGPIYVQAYQSLTTNSTTSSLSTTTTIPAPFVDNGKTLKPEFRDWVDSQVIRPPKLALALQVVYAVLCLLPATLLMGATLPIMTVYLLQHEQQLQVSLGKLYAINTAGAVLGVLGAGFIFIGAIGEQQTLLLAAGLNIVAALLAWRVSATFTLNPIGEVPSDSPAPLASAPEPAATIGRTTPSNRFVIPLARLGLFISGFTGLGLEILWTRMLTPVMGTAIYAFAGMLATFLFGITWGSYHATRLTSASATHTPAVPFALWQVAVAVCASLLLVFLPWAAVPMFILQMETPEHYKFFLIYKFLWQVLVCTLAVFPIAYCFGRQFPVGVAATLPIGNATPLPAATANPSELNAGQGTGLAYAANTLGAILGSAVTGFVLIPYLGSANATLLLAILPLISGLLLFCLTAHLANRRQWAFLLLLGCLFTGAVFNRKDPALEIVQRQKPPELELFYATEQPEGTTAVLANPKEANQRVLLLNGVGMTVLVTETKLMAHLPYVLTDLIQARQPNLKLSAATTGTAPAESRRMLVICFGMGTTVRAGLRWPELHIDAVELAPAVFACLPYFHPDAVPLLAEARLRLFAQDGRHFLLTHAQTYDMITMDPAPPLYSTGTVNLYTREFFQLCFDRLAPAGVFCLWVPPESPSEVKLILRTAQHVFPHHALFGALEPTLGGYPGFYFVGSRQPLLTTPAEQQALVQRLAAIPDLAQWNPNYGNPDLLQQLFLADEAKLAALVGPGPIITDNHPYTEFPLWRYVLFRANRKTYNAMSVRSGR